MFSVARKLISDLLWGRIHQQLDSIKEMLSMMKIDQQKQHEELRAAVSDMTQAVGQETTAIHAYVEAMERKANAEGVDLSEEINAIRQATQNIRGIVEPLSQTSSAASSDPAEHTGTVGENDVPENGDDSASETTLS